MNLCALRSSSKGNAALVSADTAKILIDCGISYKMAVGCLSKIDVCPGEIDAIVVTHEHRDHISGVGVFCRKHKTPIYATGGTWREMKGLIGSIPQECVNIISSDSAVCIKGVEVRPFSISHDAAEPVGYSLEIGDRKVSVATDTGCMEDYILDAIIGSTAVLLESNHDVNMLGMSNYPYYLKQRIRGRFGHLSNDDAADVAVKLCETGTKQIILGHLSQENNYPPLAYQTVENRLAARGMRINYDVMLDVADS